MRLDSGWLVGLGIAASAVLLASAGCGTSAVNTVLDQQLANALAKLNNTVIVEVVNQTSNDVQLDLTVDGVAQTITCTAAIQVCPVSLSTCPSEVKAIQQRSLDAQGRFVGGRVFNGSDDFSFTSGEFACDSVLIYKFTETTASAFKI